ncbi:MAG: hypothetical protein LBD48_06365 [Treponema sp.]|jgi:hypothetical protein|nr:hypothetical protein [Treponema sp.]
MILRLGLLLCCVIGFFSCGNKPRPALFPVRGADAHLYAFSRQAAEGNLIFSGPEKNEYRFESPPPVPPLPSFEIEYTFSVPPSPETKKQYQAVLESGGQSWALPLDLSFMGIDESAATAVFHYAVPAGSSFAERFSVTILPDGMGQKKSVSNNGGVPVLVIRSIEFRDRWFGFHAEPGGSPGEKHFFVTPFVFARQDGFVIDPPPVSALPENGGLLPELNVEFEQGSAAVVSAGNTRFEAAPYPERFHIPAGIMTPDERPLVISGGSPAAFRLSYAPLPAFPVPITADPGMALAWPQERWRISRYEVFRWDSFPSLLIFDTADYAVQDRMLKRLAFFAEKAGFRGRLASDAEIAPLHGWNAHDYRAADIARFFDAARRSKFPLSGEEKELEQILFDAGIILLTGDGGVSGGSGGIISISRESEDYLRSRFMAHEGFHGIFFIDEDFRNFSRRRWDMLPAQAKHFITSYFDFQHYDINDGYLMVNEFMAHILQQPVSQAGNYFGKTIAARIESSPWRRALLPEKDEVSNSWPDLARIFTTEAEAFSAYVNSRWGLAAGRAHLVSVRRP